MASTLVFLLVRHVLEMVSLDPKPDDKDVEIAVLRHQLAVLTARLLALATRRPIATPCSLPTRLIPSGW